MKCYPVSCRAGFRIGLCLLGIFIAASATSCAVIDVQKRVPLDLKTRWALLPILDLTETTMAGARVETPLMSLARTKLNLELTKYPAATEQEPLGDLDERQRYQQALSWARKKGFVYGITGSVNEWKYRNGADGEAAVGITISVVDIASDRTIWSATGSRSGWGRETASGVAQKLLRVMLGRMVSTP